MIASLRIQNFAIIEDLEVDFAPGLNVITGETGAGKSIIIDALSLLLGERSTFSQIRHGATKAFIEGTFIIQQPEVIQQIHQYIDDLIEDDCTLIVSRTLDTSGRTTIRLNQKTATQSMTKAIMSLLFDIHSQHENLELLDEKHHLQYLDRFMVDDEAKKKYLASYAAYLEAKQSFKRLQEMHLSEEEVEFLRFQIKEIEKASIVIGEMDDLEQKKMRLLNVEKYIQIKQNLTDLLDGDTGAITRLYLARRELEHGHVPQLDDSSARLDSLYYDLRELSDHILKTLSQMTESEYSLEQISDRLYTIRKIAKKFGPNEVDILNELQLMKEKVELFEKHAFVLQKQADEVENKRIIAIEDAKRLSLARQEAAKTLAMTIDVELEALALKNAHFKPFFTKKDLSEDGDDAVVFTLSANLGSPYISLKNAISGGEASRLMLGLKVVLHRLGLVETIIFDEVDTGVSGRIAKIVGTKIKMLAKDCQIIAITHLPQVASYADHHYRVHKYVEAGMTKATIHPLNEKERIHEIAGMLSGEMLTDEAIKAAQALIKESQSIIR